MATRNSLKINTFVKCQCVISFSWSDIWIAAIWTFFSFSPRCFITVQKAWMFRFRMFKWWSAADLHYSNAITTGVYNRMCLLAAFARCLRVVRKWEQQHPGDQRASGLVVAVLVVGKVEVEEVVVRHCLCGPSGRLPGPQAWRQKRSRRRRCGLLFPHLMYHRGYRYLKSSYEILFNYSICSLSMLRFVYSVPNCRFCRGSSRQNFAFCWTQTQILCFILCFTCLLAPPFSFGQLASQRKQSEDAAFGKLSAVVSFPAKSRK